MDRPPPAPLSTPAQAEEYRRRKDRFFVFMLGMFLLAPCGVVLFTAILPHGAWTTALGIIAAQAFGCTWLIWPLKHWCCPVCGQSFTKAHTTGRCEHCGIRFPG